MRESRTYGSGRGACHEMHVPTATEGASSSRCSAARRRWPLAARGQQAGEDSEDWLLVARLCLWRILAGRDEAFRQALRDLGYVQSSTIAIQYRFAEGRFDRLPELEAEPVRLNVDVIVAVVTQASLAAKDATNSIPIVMVAVSDPVSQGLVASLRHPGAFRSRFL